MKFLSSKQLKKITKSSLALVFAGSFTFSSLAFANENNIEQATNETVDLQEIQSQLGSTQAEAPSLVPGDFFYFAKIALEKIKLALTMDNSKEAELMATYASERLAEAGILYGEGKEDEALEVIQTALEYIDNSQSIIDEETDAEEVSNDQEAVTDEDAAGTDEQAEENATSEEQTDGTISDEETSDESNPYDNVEDTLRHNIAALSAAMKHVGNENAEAQLQKNIDKTRAKIAKKLAKLEKKYGKTVVENEVTDESTDAVDVVETETPVVTEDVQEATEPKIDTVPAPEETAVTTDVEVQEETVVAPVVAPTEKAKFKENKAEKKQQKGKSAEAQKNQKGNNGNGKEK